MSVDIILQIDMKMLTLTVHYVKVPSYFREMAFYLAIQFSIKFIDAKAH